MGIAEWKVPGGAVVRAAAYVALSACTAQTDDVSSAQPASAEAGDTDTSLGTASPDDDPAAPADTGDAEGSPTGPSLDCTAQAAAAADVLAARCGGCHGSGQSNGGFGDALDLEAMIASGRVVLGDLEGSQIFQITDSGEMPLGGPDLSADEQSALADWILCVPEVGEPPPDDGVGNGGGAGNGGVEVEDDDEIEDDEVEGDDEIANDDDVQNDDEIENDDDVEDSD